MIYACDGDVYLGLSIENMKFLRALILDFFGGREGMDIEIEQLYNELGYEIEREAYQLQTEFLQLLQEVELWNSLSSPLPASTSLLKDPPEPARPISSEPSQNQG